jgi:hypothetical protein
MQPSFCDGIPEPVPSTTMICWYPILGPLGLVIPVIDHCSCADGLDYWLHQAVLDPTIMKANPI